MQAPEKRGKRGCKGGIHPAAGSALLSKYPYTLHTQRTLGTAQGNAACATLAHQRQSSQSRSSGGKKESEKPGSDKSLHGAGHATRPCPGAAPATSPAGPRLCSSADAGCCQRSAINTDSALPPLPSLSRSCPSPVEALLVAPAPPVYIDMAVRSLLLLPLLPFFCRAVLCLSRTTPSVVDAL